MNTPSSPRIVSATEWLAARKALLIHEKAFTQKHDELAAERRKLPWVKIEKDYRFNGPNGSETLAALFAGRSQLIVYHFMFGPGWEEGCKSCSFAMDHLDGLLPHLAARDTSFAAISRAPIVDIRNFQQRMGWKFHWVSASDNTFNSDFHVSFSREDMEAGRVNYNFQSFPPGLMPVEELPGLSVFARTDATEEVFHTYSAYARGCEELLGTYRLLDLTPKGRDEENLTHSMAWVRHHDRYDHDYKLDPTAAYEPPRGSISRPCCAGS